MKDIGIIRGDETLPSGLIPLCCAALVFYLQVHCLCRGYGRPSHLSPIHVLRSLHRYIVRVVGMGAAELSSLETVRRSMYLVMEAMEGGTLKDAVVKQMTSRWGQGRAGGGRWGQVESRRGQMGRVEAG